MPENVSAVLFIAILKLCTSQKPLLVFLKSFLILCFAAKLFNANHPNAIFLEKFGLYVKHTALQPYKKKVVFG